MAEMLSIVGDKITSISPEGTRREANLGDLVECIKTNEVNPGEVIYPDGVKCLVPIPKGVVAVYEAPPRVYEFKWIKPGSPIEYGSGTEYETVRIALPYVIVLAEFVRDGKGRLLLGSDHNCFFSNTSIQEKGLELEPSYPALLNVSKLESVPGTDRPQFTWICTQYLPSNEKMPKKVADRSDDSKCLAAGVSGLLRHLLESGFNRSSENHELNSWYSETVEAGVDPRLNSTEAWASATEENPLFVLDVPWLPVGKSLREIINRLAESKAKAAIKRSHDLVRLLVKAKKLKVVKEEL